MGMGIHGEPGIWRDKLRLADEIADEMVSRLLDDAPKGRSRVSVLANSLGATPLEELLIVYRRVAARLSAAGAEAVLPMVGHYATSMEMAGLSITLCFLDDEIESLLRKPASSPFWRIA
jgi:dihydroxyacetone kinase-like protein